MSISNLSDLRPHPSSPPNLPPHSCKQNKVTMNRDAPQHLPISEPQENNVKFATASPDKSTETNLKFSNLFSTKPSATRSKNSALYQTPTIDVSWIIVSSSPFAKPSPQRMSQYKTEKSGVRHDLQCYYLAHQMKLFLSATRLRLCRKWSRSSPHIFEHQKPSQHYSSLN